MAGSANAQTALAEPVQQPAPAPLDSAVWPARASFIVDGARREIDLAGQRPAQSAPGSWAAERRACDGCPRRSVGRAFFDATMINVFYEVANLARGQVTARITPK